MYMEKVIAEREYGVDRIERSVVLQVLMPEKVGVDGDWKCILRIIEGGHIRDLDFYGVDSFQAVKSVFEIIPIEVRELQAKYGDELKFIDGGDLMN